MDIAETMHRAKPSISTRHFQALIQVQRTRVMQHPSTPAVHRAVAVDIYFNHPTETESADLGLLKLFGQQLNSVQFKAVFNAVGYVCMPLALHFVQFPDSPQEEISSSVKAHVPTTISAGKAL